jgi:hypothetical protein
MLQDPGRQQEYYHLHSELLVIETIGWLLSTDLQEWWKFVCARLGDQAAQGSKHLVRVMVAQWPVIERDLGTDIADGLQDAVKDVQNFYERLPASLVGDPNRSKSRQ